MTPPTPQGETPETDAACYVMDEYGVICEMKKLIPADFARLLERRLRDALAELHSARAALALAAEDEMGLQELLNVDVSRIAESEEVREACAKRVESWADRIGGFEAKQLAAEIRRGSEKL